MTGHTISGGSYGKCFQNGLTQMNGLIYFCSFFFLGEKGDFGPDGCWFSTSIYAAVSSTACKDSEMFWDRVIAMEWEWFNPLSFCSYIFFAKKDQTKEIARSSCQHLVYILYVDLPMCLFFVLFFFTSNHSQPTPLPSLRPIKKETIYTSPKITWKLRMMVSKFGISYSRVRIRVSRPNFLFTKPSPRHTVNPWQLFAAVLPCAGWKAAAVPLVPRPGEW